ncbi:hypothetical protein KY330_00525 [Candidatus Woesearchaeota archaeon]|nr:hypothetical protein [Candidatus Woesearchaeota archaeon]
MNKLKKTLCALTLILSGCVNREPITYHAPACRSRPLVRYYTAMSRPVKRFHGCADPRLVIAEQQEKMRSEEYQRRTKMMQEAQAHYKRMHEEYEKLNQ